jgi:hypothetical protein
MFGSGKNGLAVSEIQNVTRDPIADPDRGARRGSIVSRAQAKRGLHVPCRPCIVLIHVPAGLLFSIHTADRELLLEAASVADRDAITRSKHTRFFCI